MITHQPYSSNVTDAVWKFILRYLCLQSEDGGEYNPRRRPVLKALLRALVVVEP